ncbi:MAG TPA: PHB depolymerase family esterase [Thermoanaerobaculia bacterium]
MIRSIVIVTLLSLPLSAFAAPKITEETITSVGKERTYYLFIPESAREGSPLIVLLHGSGRTGKILIDHWKSLAEKEGIVLAGPNASDAQQWQMPEDGPVFLRDIVRDVQKRVAIDGRRVYLFGHSAGANFAVPMGLFQSTYFAAVAAHAGALPQGDDSIVTIATRKIPIYLVVGTRDASHGAARASHTLLTERGFPAELVEMPRHGHDYYGRSKEINAKTWAWLSAQKLERDPVYIPYANIPEK